MNIIIKPIISIIMPVYNGDSTVDRAIRSVLNQRFQYWELLVVDDGSDDGSYNRICSWSNIDLRIHPIRLAENRGTGYARNVGFAHAKGDFITYLDCDDEYYPDFLSTVSMFMMKCDLLIFNYDYINDDKQSHDNIHTWYPRLYRDLLFSINIVNPIGVAHNSRLINIIGGFNESLWNLEDWDLWKRFARAGFNFLFLDYKSGLYHIRKQSRNQKPRITSRQAMEYDSRTNNGLSLYDNYNQTNREKYNENILFVAPFYVMDSMSIRASIVRQILSLLSKCGFKIRCFCVLVNSVLLTDINNIPEKIGFIKNKMVILNEKPLVVQEFLSIDFTVMTIHANLYSDGMISPQDGALILDLLDYCIAEQVPDLVLTCNEETFNDPLWDHMITVSKRRDIPLVLLLPELGSPSPSAMQSVDHLLVFSEWKRYFLWITSGISSQYLPYPSVRSYDIEECKHRNNLLIIIHPESRDATTILRTARELEMLRPDISIQIYDCSSQIQTVSSSDWAYQSNIASILFENGDISLKVWENTKYCIISSLDSAYGDILVSVANSKLVPVLIPESDQEYPIISHSFSIYTLISDGNKDNADNSLSNDICTDQLLQALISVWDDQEIYDMLLTRCLFLSKSMITQKIEDKYKSFFGYMRPQPGPPYVPK